MQPVTGLILAGGQGRRMGGADKGLVELEGRPLIAWVLERLAPQVDEILISANRNADIYRRFGYPVLEDAYEGHAGPLAGLHAGLRAARHSLVLTVPCDSPFLPADLCRRLQLARSVQAAELAVATTGGRVQPVFSLCSTAVLASLTAFLDAGERKVGAWQATLKVAEVAFDDEAEAFANINTLDELRTGVFRP